MSKETAIVLLRDVIKVAIGRDVLPPATSKKERQERSRQSNRTTLLAVFLYHNADKKTRDALRVFHDRTTAEYLVHDYFAATNQGVRNVI